MSEPIDVAIVGAGTAGIAAARYLNALGRTVLLVEALPRLGGRACTVTRLGFPLDLGCSWLHSGERNPLTVLAEAHGLTVERSHAAWDEQLGDIQFSSSARHEAWAAYERFTQMLASNPPTSDRASDVLHADDPWRPFIDGLSSYINGVETDCLSAKDFTAYDSAASDNNWRLKGGYGDFIASLGAGLPVRFNTPVHSITESADLALETDQGVILARAAIVTVSTNVLARGLIRFDPSVDEHLHAAAHLPLGLADKVFLALSDPDAVPPESHLLGRFDRAGTGSYYLRPFGRPLVECFLGGEEACALEAADAAAFAVSELRDLLGAEFAKGLTPLEVTRWGKEPTILGSYSHALPEHADARSILAKPPSERLAFAGEACSAKDFSTAHGAWESGITAAQWIEQGLRR